MSELDKQAVIGKALRGIGDYYKGLGYAIRGRVSDKNSISYGKKISGLKGKDVFEYSPELIHRVNKFKALNENISGLKKDNRDVSRIVDALNRRLSSSKTLQGSDRMVSKDLRSKTKDLLEDYKLQKDRSSQDIRGLRFARGIDRAGLSYNFKVLTERLQDSMRRKNITKLRNAGIGHSLGLTGLGATYGVAKKFNNDYVAN